MKKVNLEKILTVFIEGRQITSDKKEKEQEFKEKFLNNINIRDKPETSQFKHYQLY